MSRLPAGPAACHRRRRTSIINAFFDLADAVITVRSLFRRAWTTTAGTTTAGTTAPPDGLGPHAYPSELFIT
ncbi:hypothetical protein T261_8010 [Streptomyces lydicus]|nr:hypothetical protein T261_8010 [Streptomyces lydicus]